jgi:hypothetical protein
MVVLSLALLSLTGSAVAVDSIDSLTQRIEVRRMTVLQVDRVAGAFQCAEHKRWTAVLKSDLRGVEPGDIVRVDRKDGQVARLLVLRTAAEELAGVER